MLSFLDRQTRLCDGIPRREWLRVGGLGVLGLSLTDLLAPRPLQAVPHVNDLTKGLSGTMFGRAKNVIFLWLQGGPPQHETFDPKPDAPREIRGPFSPIQTNIPGIQFSELLPRTAQRADKLAVIRSLSTDDNNHDVSGYWVLTGYPYGPGSARQIKPTDWPYLGSVVKMLKPSERLPALSSVWLPDMMRLNDNVTPAGQTGGFLGSMWDPERFVGDPASDQYRVEGLSLPVDLPPPRMTSRAELLGQLNRRIHEIERQSNQGNWDKLSTFAMELVTSGKAKAAFDLSQEPQALRDRYGRNTWGQSCLLARRLVEAGVRLVHVNWLREPGDSAVDNPMWDTHALNAERLQDFLCPVFDVSFAALLDDLDSRGLLSETLVVAVGEFGRTPKINRVGGRDHWGPVFSCALAGAGISGGQVFGASDRNGAYPIADAIRPHDLTATIYHLLGIPHDSVFHDLTNRPHPLTKGEPLYRLLGTEPATSLRCAATGDEALVPPLDSSPIVDTDFASGKLIPVTPVSQAKGWRAVPLAENGMQVRTEPVTATGGVNAGVRMSVLNAAGIVPVAVPANSKMVLSQEIRNARGGHYLFKAFVDGDGSSPDVFDRWFHKVLSCRLVLFRFSNQDKTPLEIQELASESFRPTFGVSNEPTVVSVAKFLGSTVPGANFSIGNGLGIAVVVESQRAQDVLPGEVASLCLVRVELEFQARLRDDNVTV
ncbi:DUF1501 domain-containing protein [Schlesneria paludicola]|uniref:DUF1501 domain-containing protein n=1 Tax=Schlesneria paludicola TaxID=360056 RepID=UPI000299E749|nr:DUF1501 domain-containing protein [Schlesneria paludicola]